MMKHSGLNATNPEQQPILIIGGGLAGLSLGQGLKQAGIPFRIYERDTGSLFRAQGYRIRIGDAGATALEQLLPPKLYKAFEATCATVEHGGHAIDALTGEPLDFKMPAGARKIHGDRAFNADRTVLRNVLLSNLEEYVDFGKRLDGYECGDGHVIARFTDGSEARGSLIIGADGVKSVVRRQLLPRLTVLDTEGRAVFGKTALTDALQHRLPKDIGHGLTIASVHEEDRIKLFTDGMRFDRAKATQSAAELGLEVPEDYVYWVLLFRKDSVMDSDDHILLSLSSNGSVEKSLQVSEGWHDSLRILLQDQIPDAASTLAFLTSTPKFGKEWSEKVSNATERVTLLGDAAHPMPPVGGLGANAAFQDAADLLSRLCEVATGESWKQPILDFEKSMVLRAQPVIEMSSGGAGRFFAMKPLSELKPAMLWH